MRIGSPYVCLVLPRIALRMASPTTYCRDVVLFRSTCVVFGELFCVLFSLSSVICVSFSELLVFYSVYSVYYAVQGECGVGGPTPVVCIVVAPIML